MNKIHLSKGKVETKETEQSTTLVLAQAFLTYTDKELKYKILGS